MSRKIVNHDYKLVAIPHPGNAVLSEQQHVDSQLEIEDLLDEGYRPHGSPVAAGDFWFVQAFLLVGTP